MRYTIQEIETEQQLQAVLALCYRILGQGVTSALMASFEKRARAQGYRVITLGSQADGFYERCGFHRIFAIEGQNIYQKVL